MTTAGTPKVAASGNVPLPKANTTVPNHPPSTAIRTITFNHSGTPAPFRLYERSLHYLSVALCSVGHHLFRGPDRAITLRLRAGSETIGPDQSITIADPE